MRTLKIDIAILFAAVCLVFGTIEFVGCSTSQQTTTFQTLSSIETVADTGYSNYVALVIKGTIPTNSLATVSKAYNDLHAGIILANTLNQAGTNATVGTNVTAELTALLNLIATATKK